MLSRSDLPVWFPNVFPLGLDIKFCCHQTREDDILVDGWGRMAVPNRMHLWKSSKGEGVIFNPKIYISDFGNFKQGFLIMKLIQNSNFRAQGVFFNNCIEKNQNKTHFEEGTSESL